MGVTMVMSWNHFVNHFPQIGVAPTQAPTTAPTVTEAPTTAPESQRRLLQLGDNGAGHCVIYGVECTDCGKQGTGKNI